MQTVSDAVRQLLDSYAKVTLSVYVDGGKLDAGVGAGSYTGACAGDDEFSFGNACAVGVNMTLAVARPDLKGRRIQITWAVDGTEYPLITGKVEKAKVTAGRTEIEVWDDMYFAGSKAFAITSTVASTCTAATAFTAVADAMGVSVEDSALALLSDIAIPDGLSELGSDVTNSAVAGYIAGMVGGNALMSRAGSLTIRQYVAVDWETEPYSGGATAENEDFAVTGITLQREKVVSTLNEDGSTSERTVSEEYLAGDGSLMLANPLASQEAVDSAFAALSAVTVRPGNYSFPGGLLLEPGDIFTVHSMDGSYAVAVGSISMSFDGGVSSSVACGGAVEDSIDIKGTINQALKALVADYTKFKKLTADNAEINSAHILELLVGDIIADRIKAGIIKSKDGSSVVIDLDNGTADIVGNVTTRSVDDGAGGVDVASLTPDGLLVGTDAFVNSRLTKNRLQLLSDYGRAIFQSARSSNSGSQISVGDGANRSNVMVYANPGGSDNPGGYIAFTANKGTSTRYLTIRCDLDGSYIRGLTAPTQADDATNKEYVDGLLSDFEADVLDNTYNFTMFNCSNVASNTGSPITGMPYYAILHPDYSVVPGTPISSHIIMLGNDSTQSGGATPTTSVMLGSMSRSGSIISQILAFSTGYQTVRATIGVWYKRNK